MGASPLQIAVQGLQDVQAGGVDADHLVQIENDHIRMAVLHQQQVFELVGGAEEQAAEHPVGENARRAVLPIHLRGAVVLFQWHALDAGEVGLVPGQHRCLGQLQRKAELGIEAAEARLQHGVDFGARRLRPSQGLGQTAEGVVIGPLGAKLDAALPQGEDKIGHFDLDG